MKYPRDLKKIDIVGRTFKVVLKNKVVQEDHEVLGKISWDTLMIQLSKKIKNDAGEIKERPDEAIFLALFHELFHASLFATGYSKLAYDEAFVERMCEIWYQIFKQLVKAK